MERALDILHSTNNFPEFTGRLCPAPCEEACVLGIVSPPVSIELIEKYIVERGFSENWIKANPPKKRTNKKIAVIGSGPSGLAAAQQLNKAGHNVTVFERDNKIGGLLRYGIPDFKMEKHIIDRRLEILIKEGIIFKCNVDVGKNISTKELEKNYDIILVSEEMIIESMRIIWQRLKIIIEPSCSIVLGAILTDNKQFNNKRIGLILTGGNIDLDALPW